MANKLGLVFALSVVVPGLYAQTTSVYDGVTPTGLAPGSPASSYPLLNFEHYDPFSGGLNPSVPLYHVGGRGNAGFDLVWNLQQVWRAKKEGVSTSPIVVVDPYPQSYPVESPTVYGLEAAGVVYSRTGVEFTTCGSGSEPGSSVTRVIFRTPTGAEIELIDKNTSASVYQIPNACSSPQSTYDAGRGTTFRSTDGSEISFVADSNVLEQINPGFGEGDAKLSGYLVFPNGVTYRIDNSTVTYIRDTNGNKTTFAYSTSDFLWVTWYLNVPAATQITDSDNRTVTINYHDSSCGTYCTTINYAGVNGAARKIMIELTNLSNGLLLGGGSVQTIASLFPTSQAYGGSTTTFDPILASAIVFPDNFQYGFLYNTYGEVTEVSVAQGGAVEYTYGDGSNGSTSGFEGNPTDANPVIIYRRLQERREYANGSGSAWTSKTDYTVTYPASQTVDTDVTYSSSSQVVAQTVHKMDGSPLDALNLQGTSCNAWNEGMEFETDYGSPVLRTVKNTLQAQSGCMNNPEISTVQTINDANQVSQVTYTYDAYNNVTQEIDYGFGSGAPGAAVRTTATYYLWANNASYASPTVNLVRAPASIYVYAGTGGAALASRLWAYDTAGTLSDEPNSADIPGHDSGYLAGGVTTRGNVSTYQEFVNTGGENNLYATYQMKYDSLGNLLSMQDPLGNTTNFSYADAFSDGISRNTYGYLTGTTNALSQTASQQYDYSSGSITGYTDSNGVLTSYSYLPENVTPGNGYAVDRLGTITRDATRLKAETNLSYPNPNVIVTQRDQASTGDRKLMAYEIRDGFGRLVESDQFNGTSSLVATCTRLDALGNPYFVTEPFQVSGSPACPNGASGISPSTNNGTIYVRDTLGRPTEITFADGAVEDIGYSGATTTVQDPAGHRKVMAYDADNNLTSVNEDPSGLNYLTLYQYDALDRLSLTCQGGSTAAISSGACTNGQGRSFAYDSLNRLISATNPESGTFTYLYDNNGNLTQRTENGRGIHTKYTYDQLNRLLTISYDDGVTPPVTFTWDQAITNGIGRLYGIGTPNGIAYFLRSYDAFGNITMTQEPVGENWYEMEYSYDLASELTSEQFASGRLYQLSYDAAGRVTGVTGMLGTQQKTYVTGVTYAPTGAPLLYGYGNGLWRILTYNPRFQPLTAVDGTGYNGNASSPSVSNPLFQATWSWNSVPQSFPPLNNGNLAGDSYTHSGGGLSAALTFTHAFSYDGVNRLTQVTETNNWQRGFSYDPYGNTWVNQASGITPTGNTPVADVYNAANNQIVGSSYDAAGNQTSVNGDKLTYDAETRLITITDPSGATETISYDGLGRRIQKSVSGGQTTVYVYDAFGALASKYLSGSTVAPLCTTCYLSADQVGSTRLVTDENGNVVARHDFQPFGEEIETTGGRTSQWGATTDVDQKFTGQVRDTDTGMDYFNARMFTAPLQRFNSPDPGNAGADLANPQSWNGYAYVWNSPVTYTDRTGLFLEANPANSDPDFANDTNPYSLNAWISFWTYAQYRLNGSGGGGGSLFRVTGYGVTPRQVQPTSVQTGSELVTPPNSGTCPAVPTGPGAPVLSSNITFARNIGQAFNILDGPLAGFGAKLLWFRSMVRNRSIWDYKNQPYPHAHPEYADFGNFNFGATGDALGLPTPILFRGAGYAQEKAGTSTSGWGHWWGSAPYGDDPKDQQQIKSGIQYVQQGCH